MKKITFLILLLTFGLKISAQLYSSYKEMFLEAESYFLFEEYNEALPLYQQLLMEYPGNDNYNYKIGVCYLNNLYEKEKAISYLEKATQNINPKFKENSFKETGAPLDAIYYLGQAYMINEQLDQATETFKEFRAQADPEVYDLELVDAQIRSCEIAKELMSKPLDFNKKNIGERINTRFADHSAVVSRDRTKLVFISELQFYDAMFFSEKVNGQWSYPRNIVPELGVDGDVYPTALSSDGTEMYIYRNDEYEGNLYRSFYRNGRWTKIEKLNDNINTKYWESHASLSPDDNTLYFTSNRKGGYGDLDIYKSERTKEGTWGPPENLGPVINTRYNEETPFMTDDGLTLYFSSYGHYNMGGYDVFYSTLLNEEEGRWAVPINAGYPINTTDDDVFFLPVDNGNFVYYSRYDPDGYGKQDIYILDIFSETHPRKFEITGMLSMQDDSRIDEDLMLTLVNRGTKDTVAVTTTGPGGEFQFEAPRGQYEILVEGDSIETYSHFFTIPEDYVTGAFDLKTELVLEKAAFKPLEPDIKILDKIDVSDTVYYVDSDKPLKIRMKLEKDALLYINKFLDTTYVSTDTFEIGRRRFTYEYVPIPGKNILKLKMVDSDGNFSFKDIYIYYTPEKQAEEEEPEVLVDSLLLQTLKEWIDLAESDELKKFLRKIDLEKENIRTVEDLKRYIKENAPDAGIGEKELKDFFARVPELESGDILKELQKDQLDEINQFIKKLSKKARGDLLYVLENLDAGEEGIFTRGELFRYLVDQAVNHGYTIEDVIGLFDESEPEEMPRFIDQLKRMAEGGLKQALDDLDLEKENIRSLKDLYEYLMNHRDEYGYSQADILNLLAEYFDADYILGILRDLIELAEGELKEFLEALDPVAREIYTLAELFEYLMVASEFQEFTAREVVDLFMKYLTGKEIPEEIPEDKVGGAVWPWFIGGIGLLLILLILFLRREKKKEA